MNNLKTTNFWNHNYRHYMRGLRTSLQSEIKQSFNDFDLELCGVSDLHEQLICEIIGDYVIEGENKNERNKRLEHSYQDECFNCQSTLGIDCGEAESDYNEDFCSHGCYVEYIYKK